MVKSNRATGFVVAILLSIAALLGMFALSQSLRDPNEITIDNSSSIPNSALRIEFDGNINETIPVKDTVQIPDAFSGSIRLKTVSNMGEPTRNWVISPYYEFVMQQAFTCKISDSSNPSELLAVSCW